ncbi:adenine nucleotide alpha hydrolase [Rossellomorea aquimaris]|uniref:adenine nucleotide alpha hydrolase n=1 Tax=Rossellomorea TaxID=2837508 RepID=UPI001CD47ABA|nr:adenine nucleotide alpha hydrolase [Rossellomorea aquimaris]MCA1060218.1 adenine nucleotide alpha hydrolase [Rossellomorea aquimaris]
MKTVIAYSGGKDSTLALYKIQQNPDYEVDSLLVTLTEGFDRVSIHGVRYEMLKQQSKALGIPLREVWIPQDCPNEVYQERMGKAVSGMLDDGITHMIFGDIHLEDVKAYRQEMLEGTGITPVFPIWGRPVQELGREFIELGFKTVLTCVDLEQLDRSFAGRVYDEDFLTDYPESCDVCGENGEFHTFVFDGPNFECPIPYELGEERVTPDYLTNKDRFLYRDVVPIK